MVYAGGGGYGDPKQRDTAAVEDDLRDGYVTASAARRHYGSDRT
jgi:N-methylhydantoinase B